jgi:predicted nucleic acid-binding protein
MTEYLIDTCVIIDYSRGYAPAIKFLETLERKAAISALTIAELYSGVRNKREKTLFMQLPGVFDVIPVEEKVAERGGLIFQKYRDKYGTDLIDALIAASAEITQKTVITRNLKHFRMLKNVIVPYS